MAHARTHARTQTQTQTQTTPSTRLHPSLLNASVSLMVHTARPQYTAQWLRAPSHAFQT